MKNSVEKLIALAMLLTAVGTVLRIAPVGAPAGGVVWIVPSGPAPTLAAAVALAGPNDEIHVSPGWFEPLFGPLVIPQNGLWIIGAPPGLGPNPTIDIKGFPITILGRDVFIWGLDIIDTVGGPNCIILAPSSHDCIIWNNTITGITPASTGILVQSINNIIALNTMSFWGTCIELAGVPANHNTVKANRLNPMYNNGIIVSGGAGINNVYWNNIMLPGPPDLLDGNPPASPPNWFDDTTGGGPAYMKGNFEANWAMPPPYPIPPFTNGYFDNWPLVVPISMIRGDTNLDGKASLADLVILATNYGRVWCTLGWDPRVDTNGNSAIDLPDLVILATNYGKTL
jgi:hypothetical protein